MVLKDSLKTIIKQIPIRFTSNQKYDAQTKRIMNIVLEKHSSFLLETSSRNSCVVHAGIYYPKDSLKTQLCLKGNRWIFDEDDNNNNV